MSDNYSIAELYDMPSTGDPERDRAEMERMSSSPPARRMRSPW